MVKRKFKKHYFLDLFEQEGWRASPAPFADGLYGRPNRTSDMLTWKL
jgi:hypothetical protein